MQCEGSGASDQFGDVPAQEVLLRIENVLISLLQSLSSGCLPSVRIARPSLSAQIDPSSGRMSLDTRASCDSVLSLHSKRTGPMLVRILKVLEITYGLLVRGERMTKRELFYMNEQLFGTQKCSDETLTLTSSLLRVPRKCINVIGNTRGVVCGALSYTENGEVVSAGRRLLRIPEVFDHIDHFSIDADFVLVVEKEAVANTLLEEDFCEENRGIVVTSCGYPDYHTRLFLRRLLNEHRSLPAFVLTDADPYGFEIMSVYLFGSPAFAGESDQTAIPEAFWLGLHLSDISADSHSAAVLSDRDRRKVELLLCSPRLSSPASVRFSPWSAHLLSMLSLNLKFELESLYQDQTSRLSDYIQWKLQNRLWL